MTFFHATPVLGILNESDSPHQNMVVVVIGKADRLRWAYVVPRERESGNAEHLYREPELFTPLKDFGVHATMTPDGNLALHQITISIATYPDGKPRHWQGPQSSTIEIHERVAGHVVQAVHAEFESRRLRADEVAVS
jgi:hypothetical protein